MFGGAFWSLNVVAVDLSIVLWVRGLRDHQPVVACARGFQMM